MGKTEKKRKWEREYEQYLNSTELEERLEYLQDLINGKVATKEEYDEHKKLAAIKANLPKVKNILELRGKLEEQRKELKDEITRRELVEKYGKAAKILEDEMEKLLKEKANLEKEIKLKPEKKAELQAKLAENNNKRQENNRKFGKCHEEIEIGNNKTQQGKFKDISLEDLKNEAVLISSNISKCNLACNKLMQGFSWKSIEVALDKYESERLIAKGTNAAKMKQNREAAKASNTKGQQANVKLKSQDEEEQEENSIATLTRWQKVKNWAKDFAKTTWGKIKEQFVDKEEQEVPEEVIESQIETKPTLWQRVKNWFKEDEEKEQSEKDKGNSDKVKTEKVAEKEESFREYLRNVAEKGMAGVEQEKAEAEKSSKEARMKLAREKLEANRAEALKREAERNQNNKDVR